MLGASEAAELGLLTSWVPVGCGVSYRNGGPLLYQDMLRVWAEMCVQGGSRSVPDFWGIPRWTGWGGGKQFPALQGGSSIMDQPRIKETNKEIR